MLILSPCGVQQTQINVSNCRDSLKTTRTARRPRTKKKKQGFQPRTTKQTIKHAIQITYVSPYSLDKYLKRRTRCLKTLHRPFIAPATCLHDAYFLGENHKQPQHRAIPHARPTWRTTDTHKADFLRENRTMVDCDHQPDSKICL